MKKLAAITAALTGFAAGCEGPCPDGQFPMGGAGAWQCPSSPTAREASLPDLQLSCPIDVRALCLDLLNAPETPDSQLEAYYIRHTPRDEVRMTRGIRDPDRSIQCSYSRPMQGGWDAHVSHSETDLVDKVVADNTLPTTIFGLRIEEIREGLRTTFEDHHEQDPNSGEITGEYAGPDGIVDSVYDEDENGLGESQYSAWLAEFYRSEAEQVSVLQERFCEHVTHAQQNFLPREGR